MILTSQSLSLRRLGETRRSLAFRHSIEAGSDRTLALDLQFQRDAAFVSRRGPLPTFTRASAAWRVNSAGLIVPAAVNEPRPDYDPTTLVSLGIKNEPQSTNVLLRSEEFSNAAWAKTLSSVTANVATAPDGAVNADKLVEDTATNIHTAAQLFSTVSGTTYTFSLFIKAAERTFAAIALLTGFPNTALIVNLSTGAVTTGLGTPLNGTAQAYTGGWYRVSFSVVATSTTASASATCYVMNGFTWADRVYAGNGSSGILIWGAQVEAFGHATSYIPTTSAAVVRSADLFSYTGGAFSGFWNASEGTLVFQGMTANQGPTSSQDGFIEANDGTANNRILFFGAAGGSTFFVGTLSAQAIIAAATPTARTAFGMAARYKVNDFAMSYGGGSPGTDVSGVVPTASQLVLGTRVGSSGALSGWIRSVQYYNRIKTNAQLQALSTPT